ncbi:MAG: sulfatase [Bacteroidales bacterium]|nr:sulfatase [Bacteroidales bacterium]
MKNLRFLLVSMIVTVSILSMFCYGCKEEVHPPNVIFFLVDDMGWSDVGCYGSEYYETPNIDRLAKEGMRFTNAYASCTVCSPTRASILTGKYPGRLHITHAIPIRGYKRIDNGTGTPLMDADYVMNLPLEEVTIAEALKLAGYATISIGKWHVCDEPEYFPEYQGFDKNVAGDGHGATKNYFYPYYNRWRMAEGYPWIEWNTITDGVPGEYLTDRLTVEAVRFIEENKERPFFLYLPHYAVHTPIQAKDSLIQKYMNQPGDTLKGHIRPEYAAMIESVDQSMGALLGKLEELDLADNTIIIFASDNGGHGKWTSNYPWRGNKGNFYEGGIRVPTIIKWPGVTNGSSICDVPIISTDFYPTLLEMVNLPLMPDQHMDGLSLLPLLKNEGELGREALYWHFPNYIGGGHPNPSPPCGVIRYHNWKLIEWFEDGQLELYDLENDPQEKKNLAGENNEIAKDLQQMLAGWRESVNAQMPEPNPEYAKEQSGN